MRACILEEKIIDLSEKIKEFPYGLPIKDGNGNIVSLQAPYAEYGLRKCMRCGHTMNLKKDMIFCQGNWVPAKKSLKIQSWECPNCSPNEGSQPVAINRDLRDLSKYIL